jgi:DNA polymerase III subunit epsilon
VAHAAGRLPSGGACTLGAMSWHDGRLAAFDIETTGVDPCEDRIVTAAVCLAGGGRPVESYSWLVDPGCEIPEGATAVHGISTLQAREDGRDAAEAVGEVTAILADQLRLGVPVIAFNARFDLTCLDREARRHGIAPLVERVGGPGELLVVDPFVLDKQFDRYRRGKRTLGAVCDHYRVRLDAAHAAGADALAAARVAWRLGQTIAELRETELRLLHGRQVAWAAEQARSLQDHFREQGRDEVVEPAWPIVPLPAPLATPVLASAPHALAA